MFCLHFEFTIVACSCIFLTSVVCAGHFSVDSHDAAISLLQTRAEPLVGRLPEEAVVTTHTSRRRTSPLRPDADGVSQVDFLNSRFTSFIAEGQHLTSPFSYEHSLDFVLVVPEYKMLFCYIPKNACSEFNSLMNTINRVPASSAPWMLSNAKTLGWTDDQIVKALRDDSWFKATALRSPLSRLLSGYLSKCAPDENGTVEDHGEHCVGFVDEVRLGQPPSFAAFVQNLGSLDTEGISDMHFRPQVDFCGGLNTSEYNVVVDMEDDLDNQVSENDLNSQVREMLKKAALFASSAGIRADIAWKPCAVENHKCACNGTARYGQGSAWSDLKNVKGTISCDNVGFGSDPSPYIAKMCECSATGSDGGKATNREQSELVDQFFPQQGSRISSLTNKVTSASSPKVFRDFYTSELRLTARQLYKQDLRKLHLHGNVRR